MCFDWEVCILSYNFMLFLYTFAAQVDTNPQDWIQLDPSQLKLSTPYFKTLIFKNQYS